MKKSKLLIPAVGFLMISLAAAGTSTVAWFTSTTAATATLGNIVGAKVDGGLKIYATNAATVDHDSDTATAKIEAYGITDQTIDTTAEATTTLAYGIQTKGYLRDASLNLTTSAGTTTAADYIPKDYNAAGAPTSYEITTHSVANSSFYMMTGSGTSEKDIYTYAKFTVNFVSQAAEDQAVYFNFSESKAGVGNSFTTTDGAIEQALRIGFVSSYTTAPSYTTPTIFAPANPLDISGTDGAGLSYVNGTATTNTGKYTKAQAINQSVLTTAQLAVYPEYTSFSEDVYGYHTKLSYLGAAKKDNEFKVTFYVWFDGTDPKCVDTDNLTAGITSVFQASLKFFSVKQKASA